MAFHSYSAQAGTLTGPGTVGTVAAGDTAETWQVSNGATLQITTGGEALETVLTGGTISADGASITSSASPTNSLLRLQSGSTGVLNNTNVSHTGATNNNVAIQVQDASTLTMNGGSVYTSSGRAFNIRTEGVVTLNNVNVRADSAGTAVMTDGVGVNLQGGELQTTGGQISGAKNALLIFADTLASSPETQRADIAGTSLVSDTGPAIRVTTATGKPANATIVLRDGTTVQAGNGNLLEADNATVDLQIENSSLTGNIVVADTALVDTHLSNGAVLTGSTTNAGVLNMTLDDTSTWNVTGDSSVTSLSNAGNIAFSEGSAGRTLTVSGDYTGNGGLLTFNSVLAGDGSETDKLVVIGDTSGTTRVSVRNLGGSGASTVEGIELISVGGNSAGEFTQEGRIVAGAYDYHLARGTGDLADNWYLSSKLSGGGPGNEVGFEILRPEGGSYAANMAANQTMFMPALADRQVATEYVDPVTGEKAVTSLWVHQEARRTRDQDTSGQLSTRSNQYVMMLGGDLLGGSFTGNDQFRAGLLAGSGSSRSDSKSDITGYTSKGNVTGYTVGGYGTWYANGNDHSGLYLDSVLQYSWFTNHVKGEDISGETYRSHGLQISTEAGYVVPLATGTGMDWFIQPSARLSWSGIKAVQHKESNGTNITARGEDNLRSRTGVKLFAQETGGVSTRRPFMELNWIHNTQPAGVTMDDITISTGGSRNIGEARLGMEGNVTDKVRMSGAIAQQMGSQSYSSTLATLDISYTF